MQHNLQHLLEAYGHQLTIQRFSENTIHTRTIHLRMFVGWCQSHGIAETDHLSPTALGEYQAHLAAKRTKCGTPLCVSSQHSYLISLRSWFRWLMKEGLASGDLENYLTLPKLGYRLPRFLTAAEIERVLSGCRLGTRTGIRDRALLETLYSSGIRRTELLRLKVHDIDWHKELLTIRMGKGRKDRVVPVGERALAWIDRYLWEVRPRLLASPDSDTAFLTRTGRPFTPNHLSLLTKRYIQRAVPHIEGACHIFRHSMATLMLEGGADIRYIQQMLGHTKLSTTQIHTHVSVTALKEVHTRTHPAARLRAFTKEALQSGSAAKRHNAPMTIT